MIILLVIGLITFLKSGTNFYGHSMKPILEIKSISKMYRLELLIHYFKHDTKGSGIILEVKKTHFKNWQENNRKRRW